MVPVANFSFLSNPTNPLEIQFQGFLSSNGATINTWAWTFGDLTTSNVQNPLKTYAAPGVYLVSLTVTGDDGSSSKYAYLVISESPNLVLPIINLVEQKIPPSVLDYAAAASSTRKWQLFLQKSPDEAISDDDVFVESEWPALFNVLISELVVYEMLENKLTNFIGSAALPTTGVETQTRGGLKSLETGPAKTEFYENSAQDLEKQGYFVSLIYAKGKGALEEYKSFVCQLAQRLRVKLPICQDGYKVNTLFVKA